MSDTLPTMNRFKLDSISFSYTRGQVERGQKEPLGHKSEPLGRKVRRGRGYGQDK